MDDPDLAALLDELGSEGSGDESEIERTLDDILGDDGDNADFWKMDSQASKETNRVVEADSADQLQSKAAHQSKTIAGFSMRLTLESKTGEEAPAKKQNAVELDGETIGASTKNNSEQEAVRGPGISRSHSGGANGVKDLLLDKGARSRVDVHGKLPTQATPRVDHSTLPVIQHCKEVEATKVRPKPQEAAAALSEPKTLPRDPSSAEVSRQRNEEDDLEDTLEQTENEAAIETGTERAAKFQVLEKQTLNNVQQFNETLSSPLLKGDRPKVSAAKSEQGRDQPQQQQKPDSKLAADVQENLSDGPVKELSQAPVLEEGSEVAGVDRASMEVNLKARERDLEKLLEGNIREADGGMHRSQLEALESREQREPEHLERQASALQIAEELERLRSSSGAHLEEGAAAQPMQLEGAWTGPPAIGVLRVEEVETLSAALGTPVMKRDHGEPRALALHPNFVAVSLSRGGVLVAPGSAGKDIPHRSQSKAFVLGGGGQEACCALDMHPSGELLLAGYSDATLVLWDVQRATAARASFGVGADEHAAGCPITHVRFLASLPDQPRISRAVTADAKGIVMLHIFSSVPILRRYTVVSQRLLDGSQSIGPVLDLKPLITSEAPPSPTSISIPPTPNPHHNEPDRGQKGILTPRQSYSETGGQPNPAGTPPGERAAGRFDKGLDMGRKVLLDAGLDKSLDMGRKFLFDAVSTAADAGKVIAGAGPVKGVAEDLIEKGLVAMLTGSTILVALLAEKMQVLVRMPRPETVRDGTVPYCAWRKPRHWPPFQNTETPPRTSETDATLPPNPEPPKASTYEDDRLRRPPLLAVGWDRTVLVCRLGRGGLRVLSRWQIQSTDGPEPADVTGITWLTDDVIGVLTAREELCVYWVTTGEEIERFMVGVRGGEEAAVSHSHYATSAGSPLKAYHNSLAARGPALFVLGPSGLRVARLLHWKERIEGLRQAGDWLGAFHAAMELYDGNAKGVLGIPASLPALQDAIMPTLLSLLTAYIDEAMAYVGLSLGTSKAAPGEPSPGVAQYSGVGGVAIEFCVHIGRPEVLFEDVFDKFTAVGHQGTFLELLEPYILKDTLRSLAPAVMQALVEHYSEKGWLQRVEQCILHMSIASLDFNQVVRLCRQHLLYSALIYVFSSGLDDFVTPLEELLAVAQDGQSAHGRAFGYKLLVYLKHCFLGLAFPPGNGPLDPGRLSSLRSELIRFLLAPGGSSTAPGDVSEATEDVGTSNGHASDARTRHEGNQNRFPRLRYLLTLDAPAALKVLSAAFPEHGPLGVGGFGHGFRGDRGEVSVAVKQAIDSDGLVGSSGVDARVMSNEEASTSSPGRLGLRKVGSKLGKRLFHGVNSWRGGDSPRLSTPLSEGLAAGSSSEAETGGHADAEVDGVPEGDALVQMVVHALLEIVQEKETVRSSTNGVQNVASIHKPGDLLGSELGGRLLHFSARFVATGHAVVSPAVLDWLICQLCESPANGSFSPKAAGSNNRGPDSKANQAAGDEALIVALLRGALGLPKPAGSLDGFDAEGLLRRMEGLGFWQATALLHAAQGRFAAALDSLLKDSSHAAQTFAFVNQYLGDESAGSADAEKLRSAVLRRLPALVRLDANAAACIVADHLASDNDRVLKALGPFPDLQFAYLKGIVTAQAAEAAPGVGGPGTSRLGDLLQRAGIEVTDEVAELYVGLMCRFEPGSVLPFLEGHQAYRLEQCLALCQQFGVTDASAYLLERMGDVGAALNLVLSQVTSKMAALDAAVASRVSRFDEADQPDVSDLPELPAAEKALDVAIALCQRNTQRMEPRETEALWFRLVKQYMEPLRGFKEGAVRGAKRANGVGGQESYPGFQREIGSDVSNGRRSVSGNNRAVPGGTLQCAGHPPAARVLRRVLARFISGIMYAMMGHVPLATILNKILQEHGGDEFGDFKGTILGMLGTFGYERDILRTARDLIEDDTWQSLDQLKRLRSHGLAPTLDRCCVCERQLSEKPPERGGDASTESAPTASSSASKAPLRRKRTQTQEKLPALQVYVCGHVAHAACTEAGGPDCPVCGPPGKIDPGDGRNPGKRPVVEEPGTYSGGSGVLPEMRAVYAGVQPQSSPSQRSRLAMLRDMNRGSDLYGRSEGLQLAPPPVSQTPSYVERVPGRLPRRASYAASAQGSGPELTVYSSPIDEDNLT